MGSFNWNVCVKSDKQKLNGIKQILVSMVIK